eukprot:994441-Prorocentrum_minimum.AAC.1
MPTLSPLVLMASRPHSATATVSGYAPLCLALWSSRMAPAMAAPRSIAAGEGILMASHPRPPPHHSAMWGDRLR